MTSTPQFWAAARQGNVDASALLGIGVFLLLLRVPMGLHLLGALALVVVLLQPRVSRRVTLFELFLFLAVLSSLAGFMLDPGLNSYFIMAVEVGLFSIATLRTGNLARNLSSVQTGAFAALMTHLVISLFEVATGFKILPLRNPAANTAERVATDPFAVASLFTNFNDYSVAMAILSTMILVRIVFSPDAPLRVTLGRVLALVALSFLVVYIGSRGSLGAMVFMGFLAILMVVRYRRPSLVTTKAVIILLVVLGLLFLVVWQSPYLQDNSTSSRNTILERSIAVILSNPSGLVTGFGSAAYWDALAASYFPGALMNPHNLHLELVIAFGIIPMSLFAIATVLIAVRGVVLNRGRMCESTVVGVTVTTGLFILGAIPSGFLAYGYWFIFPVLALGSFALARQDAAAHHSPRATRIATTSPDSGASSAV